MQSNGFIFAIGTLQYIEMGGALYEAPRNAKTDPDGYPYGMLPHRGLSSTKDELIKEIARWGGHKMDEFKFESEPEVIEMILEEEERIKRQRDSLMEQEKRQQRSQRAEEYNERILEDDYPVYLGYWYLLDGEPQRSFINGGTITSLKYITGAKEVRRCDAIKRGLPLV